MEVEAEVGARVVGLRQRRDDGSFRRGGRILLRRMSSVMKGTGSRGRIVHINEPERNGLYRSNVVRTSKFTLVNAIPRLVMDAFSKFANAYFLIVSVLQMWPSVSITNGVPYSLGPLLFVLVVEMITSLVEDYKRRQGDRIANETRCEIYDGFAFRRGTWSQVRVGDIVSLSNRETVPADVLLLGASNGVCYIETKSLDGETNLKRRYCPSQLIDCPLETWVTGLEGTVECQAVDANIDSFDGVIHGTTSSGESIDQALTIDNLLLRGTIVRSADPVFGLVLCTGHDTKIMMSTNETRTKMSQLDGMINQYMFAFVLIQLGVCICAAIMSFKWSIAFGEDAFYLHLGGSNFLKQVFTFFLLIANCVPIALYVAMKTSRMFQAYCMVQDRDLIHTASDGNPVALRVGTMDLNDSLGQIDYIFSDKTGTLTKNVMDFRKFSVNGVSYGKGATTIGVRALEREGRMKEAQQGREEIAKSALLAFPPNFRYIDDPENSVFLAQGRQRECLDAFFLALAICNDVTIESSSPLKYSAASPDDLALVTAAQQFGFTLQNMTTRGTIQVNNCKYETLAQLPFSSSRRRMSTVVREHHTGEVFLYCKGADDVLLPRLCTASKKIKPGSQSSTEQHLEEYADQGLRTLVVARKCIQIEVFEEWKRRFDIASQDLNELEKKKKKQPNQIDSLFDELELDLELLGVTAIEDMLQDNVPEAITSLLSTGICVWMLTGDKEETAINIAYACNLFDQDMETLLLTDAVCDTEADVLQMLVQWNDQMSPDTLYSLVLGGKALEYGLGELCKDELRHVCIRCKAVVACRTNPIQKARLVALVKSDRFTTLAIGDGANDVPMIQEAHIGVGISGEEGMQAANSAEFAIGQFSFLVKLLLVHGRLNYRRMCKLILLMFYKNILLMSAQFTLTFYNGYSGQKFYLELALQSFNLIYTMLPTFLLSISDKDLPEKALLREPALYCLGRKNELFSPFVFWMWVSCGLADSIVIFGIASATIGTGSDLWTLGCLVFTAVVVVTNLKVALEQGTWRWYNVLAFLVTILLWPVTAFLLELPIWLSTDWGFQWLYVFRTCMGKPDVWFAIVLISVCTTIPQFSLKGWDRITPTKLSLVVEQKLANSPREPCSPSGRYHRLATLDENQDFFVV
uniref:Phospholipid-transporting ATPase n=1 Tax=Mucochytrium quahogii TaxID=96639 RepID=A0A7S2RS23_9STRA|mmetsp:Transcript_17503/g.28323  ORF Transcript_17503/g.28323 Transcript_17503/m.28323 type:complete len:1146 (+) Transcript_17503:46-3483(+)